MPGIKHETRSISLFMVMDYHTLDMEENIKDLYEHQGPKVRLDCLLAEFKLTSLLTE